MIYGCSQPRELWFIDLIMYIMLCMHSKDLQNVRLSREWYAFLIVANCKIAQCILNSVQICKDKYTYISYVHVHKCTCQ